MSLIAFSPRRATTLVALLAIALAALAASNDFEHPASSDTAQQFAATNVQRQDTPNDPGYDCAELDTHASSPCSNLYDERFDLFGFPSQLTRDTALYADPADSARFGQPQISGFNAAGAWKIERGRPDVTIAILDTGIKWDQCGLRTQIRLNAAELPLPRDATGATHPGAALGGYDLNGNGRLDVDDYKDDARVKRAFASCGGLVTAYDLIRAFSDGSDADGNGYVDDIAGWNFFDDNNDPTDRSSYFAASNHGSGRANDAVQRANDGDGDLGTCPHCTFVPMRIWDTFVADANSFCLAIGYAADNGVKVIEGADGALYHPAFCDAAVEYAHHKGSVMTFSGDDLNTGNHNYPGNYNHVMLIQGTVPDSMGLGFDNAQFQQVRSTFCQGPLATQCPGSNVPTLTYFRGANTTQFGGHSSISMEGATGSINTGKAAGAAGIVVSAGLDFSPALPLSPDEVRAILEQTAEDITPLNTLGVGLPDLTQAGWDSHFGYGRVNLGAAVQAVKDGNIPPEASITGPDWYAPLTGARADITGLARARRVTGGRFHYKLEWGTGLQPTSWTTVQEADASGIVTSFGTLDLAAIRAALASFTPPLDTGDASFAVTGRHPLKDQFTVRLTVTDPARPAALPGVDRKVLTAVPDGQNLLVGFPRRLGSGGEAPLRYADLNGDNVQELILPTEDGVIHAYQPDGSELPGWPVRTEVFPRSVSHLAAPIFAGGIAPPREPPRGPAIADLDDDGNRQVVVTAGLRVYVFNADGSPRKGFPVKGNDAFCTPDQQKQENLHPKCGFIASAALARLYGPGKPASIVAPSLDGHLYAWRGDGRPVAWSPVALQDTSVAAADRQVAESISNPAIGDLDGDGKDDIVTGSNEAYDDDSLVALPSLPGQPSDVSFGGGTTKSTRVYAISGATGKVLSGWPIRISGIIQDVLPFIGPGADAALAKVNGSQRIVASATGTGLPVIGSGLATYTTAGAQSVRMLQDGKGPASNITDVSGGINLFESAIFGNLTGVSGAPLSVVKYQLGVAAAANLLLVGQNFPYNHMIGAWDATTGVTQPAFPTVTDDYQFLSSSTIAKVVAGTSNQIVSGTGLGLLHAYDGITGLDVSGFPKVTGGWLFAPAALSNDGRVAAITREGFLFQWNVGQPACQSEWPSFRHDQQGSGNYDRDGTPPGALTGFTATQNGSSVTLSWKATGDDNQCGTAAQYRVLVDGVALTTGLPTPAAAGSAQSLTLSNVGSGLHRFVVQAVDEAGNVGFPATATAGNRPPVAALTASPTTGTAPLTTLLDASASVDPDAGSGDGIAEYRFDFGDGSSAARATPTASHVYTSAGSYTAQLIVVDRRGAVSPMPAQVVITVQAADGSGGGTGGGSGGGTGGGSGGGTGGGSGSGGSGSGGTGDTGSGSGSGTGGATDSGSGGVASVSGTPVRRFGSGALDAFMLLPLLVLAGLRRRRRREVCCVQ